MPATEFLRFPDKRSAVEAEKALTLIASLIEACPRRAPTSDDERRAQELLRAAYIEAGLDAELIPFYFSQNLYANLALHFGVSTLASLIAPKRPALALGMHLTAGLSYLMDSTREGFFLRRLFDFRRSQNLVATLPAKTAAPRLRVVFVAHADAAYTGTLFESWFVDRFASKPGSPLYKSLKIATYSVFGLATLDLAQLVSRRRIAGLNVARALFTIPSLAATLLNLEIVARDEIVPGANDNLSGAVGGLLLANRLINECPDDVEVVFVTTGCEEASLGGADALASYMRNQWSTDNTVIIGIDGFSNGDLRYFEEGEVVPIPLDPRLTEIVERVAAADERFSDMERFVVPVGGTDCVPFARRGYSAVCIGCVDPALGAPRHYHQRTDTVEHLDGALIVRCVDYVHALFNELCASFPAKGGEA